MRVVVIGAANVDICGKPFNPLLMKDSNPGVVSLTYGGVGRNIAHNLSLLGVDVTFIAALGEDTYAEGIMKSCNKLGFDMSRIRHVKEGRTSTYLYITDPSGDMALAICDTDVADTLTPEFLSSCLDTINSADAVVIDGNLTKEAIEFVAENCTVPLYADPVSITKAERMRGILGKLEAFKPNDIEAMHLTDTRTPEEALHALREIGVKRVFISMGANGVIAADATGEVKVPCEQATVVNTTGAGDATVAAIIWAGLQGMDLETSAKVAMKA